MSKFDVGEVCTYRSGIGMIKEEFKVKVVFDSGRGIYRVRRLEERNDRPLIIWAVETSLEKIEK